MHHISRSTLHEWIKQGRLAPEQLDTARAMAGLPPAPVHWQSLFDRLLLWLGALCIGAGLIFFVAFNWQALGRLSRLALLELPLLVMLLALWRVPLRDSSRQALLGAIALNIGALLALVGQTYQTGADPWQLFATWALMLLPLAALGKSQLLWALSWLLGQLALVLYWRLDLFTLFFALDEEALGWCLTLLNGALWGLLLVVPRRWALMPSELAGLAAGLGATLLALLAIFDAASPWVWLLWLGWLAAGYVCWHHTFITGLAMGCLSLIAVIIAALGKWIQPDITGFLLLSLIAIGLSASATRWLQQQRRSHA
ncbi:DUF2157 domain-containing protein [Aeromonas cavernicola]|uniref:DUF2157 domain-containing protein n=1 Tax=Aeromonas cavernicola TaxID=1006623 RepID=A0A2H9U0B7_9GAMM|nr:DUF2157 domain-containing protein [Aeromonas cavernicola]PJG57453.1 DUF2157 domain-containing protein [Aeromonas cavernicola]